MTAVSESPAPSSSPSAVPVPLELPVTRSELDADPAFRLHRGGKISITGPVVETPEQLALAYTPGVARVCTAIAEDPALADTYTWRSHTVAVVSDGTAVLGLGDIGPAAAMPVMEGKALLFKQFGGVDAVPLCLDETDTDALVDTIARLAPSFGGINLEDISAPRCFEVERRLQARLDIPVFHDDQHGTAIVVLAALRNAARVTGRTLSDLRVVVSGAGAAGNAVSRMVLDAGIGDLAVADRKGLLHTSREDLDPEKRALAEISNREGRTGTLLDALRGADVFLGLSGGTIPVEVVRAMAPRALVFAMANPTPEVMPDVAHAAGAAVVATGRSDFPNQINNVLAFPGVFRGTLSVGAPRISEGMKQAAAAALAAVVEDELSPTCVIPSAFDPRVAPAVASAVAAQARAEGLARR